MNKTRELKERAGASPTALAVLGGVIGASLGAYFAKSRSRAMDVSYIDIDEEEDIDIDIDEDIGRRSEGQGVTEKAKETLRQAGERSSAALEDVRYRASDIKERASSGFFRAWDEQPLLVSAGFVVLGALAALLAPVPERERELAAPVRRKAKEGMQKLGEKVESAISGEEAGEEMGRETGEHRAREIPIQDSDTGYPPVVH